MKGTGGAVFAIFSPQQPAPAPAFAVLGPAKPTTAGATRLFVIGLLESFYLSNPNHPLFGQFADKRTSAPIDAWRKYFNSWIDRVGDNLMPDNCWLTTTQIKLSKAIDGKQHLYASVQITKLLAFLMNPTPANWTTLTSTDLTRPFDHTCNRGPLSGEQGCVNGIWHGRYTTRAINEDRKKCTNGCLALCPGHGDINHPRVKCIFTKRNGTPAPCRMEPTHLPLCNHQPRCY
jgi:hypothetical protein